MRESQEAQEGVLTLRQDVHSGIMLNKVNLCPFFLARESVVSIYLTGCVLRKSTVHDR